jgi:hypothetical protein
MDAARLSTSEASMKYHIPCEPPLATLDRSVACAIAFFAEVDEELSDGHQSARAVLSHLVFWHDAYVGIAWALVTHRTPPLFSGTSCELNSRATEAFRSESMGTLCEMLAYRQRQLMRALCRLPDWSIAFPIKHGDQTVSAVRRLHDIDTHIHSHVLRLQRAAHRHEHAFALAA